MSNSHARFKKLFGLVAAIATIGFLGACHHHSAEDRIGFIGDKIASKLDFNDQQKTLLSDITQELKKDFSEEKNIRLSLKSEVENMIQSDQLDKERIKTLIKEKQERMNAKIDKYLEKISALHKTLNKEQKQEIIEKIEKFTEKIQ